MNLAAAAGGAAARVAVDRAAQWWNTPPPQNPPPSTNPFLTAPLQAALPRGGRRRRGNRGRGRRPQAGRRTGGQPSAGLTSSGSLIIVRDTEVLGAVTGKLQTYAMNPSPTEMPRLTAFSKMYARFRIKYMNVSYVSGSGTATTGNLSVGILAGVADKTVVDQSTIMKLRPSFFTPAWKSATISLGADIDLQRYMLCNDATADGVAFTLYIMSSVASIGVIKVSYEVEFSQPRPFS